MKTLIVAVNSKYIHSSLSVWYLKSSCGCEYGEIKVSEYTINDNIDSVLSSVYLEKANVVAVSCYIWNIAYVLRLTEGLKEVLPHIKIVLGGPEVSYDPRDILKTNPCIDFIIAGEGEHAFRLLLKNIYEASADLINIKGLTYRVNDSVYSNGGFNLIENLDSIPSPYGEDMLASIGDKRIVYYESSRGCPFSCAYCISSTFEGVRCFSLERVKRDLAKLIDAKVKQIKFVDRTFNCNRSRAMEILKFVVDNAGETNFHFEAGGDLFDDEMLRLLSQVPKGLIQFEIGIQTVNEKAAASVNRRTNLNKLFDNIEKLRSQNNIHLHLDIIAGLPWEDYESFGRSFDYVYALKPHQLQLGFLKLLKGSAIREDAEQHLYRFKSYPPYEVLCNKYISYDEIIELKGIEDMVEKYYNSGKFQRTLKYAVSNYFDSAFEFYRSFNMYVQDKELFKRAVSLRELYGILKGFLEGIAGASDLGLVNELLKFDFLSADSSNNLPEGLERERTVDVNELTFEFLKKEANIDAYLRMYKGVPAKQIFKKIHIEIFNYDIISENLEKEKTAVIFNYSGKDRVTGLYEYIKIKNIKFHRGGFYEYS